MLKTGQRDADNFKKKLKKKISCEKPVSANPNTLSTICSYSILHYFCRLNSQNLE